MSFISLGKIADLRGQRFGRLTVPRNAEPEIRDRAAYWPCVCDCGTQPYWARAAKLKAGRIVSCGCARADPAVRQGARLRTPAKRRREIARMGGAAARAIQD